MEGTTGLILQAALRLTNKKTRSITILKAASLEDIFSANKRLRFDPDVCSIDLLSKEVSSLLGLENKYHIFVEFETEKGSFKADEYRRYLKLKNKAYKKAATEGFYYMSNVKFLIDSLQDFLIYLEDKNIPYISHLASGVIYPMFRASDIEKIQAALQLAKRLRGRIAYNFGAGLTKKDALEMGEKDIVQRVKKRHEIS
jgi:FAD/FMN-containing dehydrogenase